MQINRSIRQALFAPEIQTTNAEDSALYINANPRIDSRLSPFIGEAITCIEENGKATSPDKIILQVNLMGIPIESSATAQRIDNNRSIGTCPVYSEQSAYDREGVALIKLGGHRAIEITYSGSGSALFLTSGKHLELSIEANQIANNAGKILIPENNILYTKPFAFQPTRSLEEIWRRDKLYWVLESPKVEGSGGIPVIISLHAFGGIWQDELNPTDMEQIYFQIGNNGGKTRIYPTKTKSWQAEKIEPSAKFSNSDGKGIVCWDNISNEESISLEQAIGQGFAKISVTNESGEIFTYKSSQILRSVVNTKTFDIYFLRMEGI